MTTFEFACYISIVLNAGLLLVMDYFYTVVLDLLSPLLNRQVM